MAERVVLHVGLMKSGTTYLQSALFANRAALAAQGVLSPGATWNDQFFAVLDALGPGSHQFDADLGGRWAALAEEIRAAEETAVLSVERLGIAARPKIERMVADLAPARVEVVLSARDLSRSVVAMWQETIQNGHRWTWAEYLDSAERGVPRPGLDKELVGEAGRTFWLQQNLGHLARKWSAVVGADRVTLVTVPQPGAAPTELLERFARACGFSALGLTPGERANAALGAGSLEVLRRLNAVLDERGLGFPKGRGVRKQTLAKQVMAARSRAESRVGAAVPPWIGAPARRIRADIEALGVRVVGDLDELEPVPVPGIDAGEVTQEEVLEAARAAYDGLAATLAASAGTPQTLPELVAALADLVEGTITQGGRP